MYARPPRASFQPRKARGRASPICSLPLVCICLPGRRSLPEKGSRGQNEKWQLSVKSCYWPSATENKAENSSGRIPASGQGEKLLLSRDVLKSHIEKVWKWYCCVIFIPNIHSQRKPEPQCLSGSLGKMGLFYWYGKSYIEGLSR